MDDFSTERLGAPSPVSDTLTPETRRDGEGRPRAKASKLPSPKLPEEASPDDTPHKVDELA